MNIVYFMTGGGISNKFRLGSVVNTGEEEEDLLDEEIN